MLAATPPSCASCVARYSLLDLAHELMLLELRMDAARRAVGRGFVPPFEEWKTFFDACGLRVVKAAVQAAKRASAAGE